MSLATNATNERSERLDRCHCPRVTVWTVEEFDSDAYVPAADPAAAAVRAGELYLRGRSGGREASGSF